MVFALIKNWKVHVYRKKTLYIKDAAKDSGERLLCLIPRSSNTWHFGLGHVIYLGQTMNSLNTDLPYETTAHCPHKGCHHLNSDRTMTVKNTTQQQAQSLNPG